MFCRQILSIVQSHFTISAPSHPPSEEHSVGKTEFSLQIKLVNHLRVKLSHWPAISLSLDSHSPKFAEKAGQTFKLNKNYIKPCFVSTLYDSFPTPGMLVNTFVRVTKHHPCINPRRLQRDLRHLQKIQHKITTQLQIERRRF